MTGDDAAPPPLAIGATGAGRVSRPPPPREAHAPSAQRQFVHGVARVLGARAAGETAAEPRGAAVSFHRFELAGAALRADFDGADRVSIALHDTSPVAAFLEASTRDVGLGETHFLDPPSRLDATSEAGGAAALGPWVFWRKTWLDMPLQDALVAHLPDWERQEIAYWRPPTLGALLFNRWD